MNYKVKKFQNKWGIFYKEKPYPMAVCKRDWDAHDMCATLNEVQWLRCKVSEYEARLVISGG